MARRRAVPGIRGHLEDPNPDPKAGNQDLLLGKRDSSAESLPKGRLVGSRYHMAAVVSSEHQRLVSLKRIPNYRSLPKGFTPRDVKSNIGFG